jgi:hypothetical protein
MSHFKRIAALIAFAATAFTIAAPAARTSIAGNGPRVHCC